MQLRHRLHQHYSLHSCSFLTGLLLRHRQTASQRLVQADQALGHHASGGSAAGQALRQHASLPGNCTAAGWAATACQGISTQPKQACSFGFSAQVACRAAQASARLDSGTHTCICQVCSPGKLHQVQTQAQAACSLSESPQEDSQSTGGLTAHRKGSQSTGGLIPHRKGFSQDLSLTWFASCCAGCFPVHLGVILQLRHALSPRFHTQDVWHFFSRFTGRQCASVQFTSLPWLALQFSSAVCIVLPYNQFSSLHWFVW